MDRDLIHELLLGTIKEMQTIIAEHTKALAALDKAQALIDLKIAMATAAGAGAFALAQHFLLR